MLAGVEGECNKTLNQLCTADISAKQNKKSTAEICMISDASSMTYLSLQPELDFQAKGADRIIPPDLSPQTAKTLNMGGGRLEERKYSMSECKASCFPPMQHSPEGEQVTVKRAALFKHLFCFALLLRIEIKRKRKSLLEVEWSTSFYVFVL